MQARFPGLFAGLTPIEETGICVRATHHRGLGFMELRPLAQRGRRLASKSGMFRRAIHLAAHGHKELSKSDRRVFGLAAFRCEKASRENRRIREKARTGMNLERENMPSVIGLVKNAPLRR